MTESYQYRLSELAVADLERIYAYGICNYDVSQADLYYYEFFQMFQKIAENPFLFQTIDHIRPGYRRCLCGRDHIYFRINGQIIEIMAIIGSQSLELWLP
ncbi:hypothetical protein AGRI_04286 [Alishewanella agri BL06]|jgi:toxin ParE1/3/4|uniref:Plasmid stabilization system n=1 Tax=Alishewanella agri BL06 TaxID=1195246 RepID=I9P4S5_9ALTE|nr:MULTISPECIES: type II toxin-antitoxin system RelE/ParE family toxin [Alishewanella]EIW89834.1 hypothetical protein AGRI_04286 [Alishewanella agri BL06]MCT8126305.1 type II toxin-antitoxin system RelE/ParE family toxin [Alishewanella sp. BS5-314]